MSKLERNYKAGRVVVCLYRDRNNEITRDLSIIVKGYSEESHNYSIKPSKNRPMIEVAPSVPGNRIIGEEVITLEKCASLFGYLPPFDLEVDVNPRIKREYIKQLKRLSLLKGDTIEKILHALSEEDMSLILKSTLGELPVIQTRLV